MNKDNEQPPEEKAGSGEYPSSPGADKVPQGAVNEQRETEAEPESEEGAAESGDDGQGGPETAAGEPSGNDDGGQPADGSGDENQYYGPGWFQAPPPPDRPPSSSSAPAGQAPGNQSESPTSAWRATPYQQPPEPSHRKKTSKAPLFLGIGVAAALVVGVVLIVTMLTGNNGSEADPSAGGNGIIAEDVSPFDFEEGQCFTDFSGATQPATVVTCETPHEAQLVNTFHYEEDAEFPGEEALAQKAEELCRNTQLSAEANQYEGNLRQQTAYPQPESWQAGDRRVDCFHRITDGELTGSLVD